MKTRFYILLLFALPFAGIPANDLLETELTGFNRKQRTLLHQTFYRISKLKKGELKIPANIYNRITRFKTLFGFEFDGKKINSWISKRIKTIRYANSWTAAVHHGDKQIVIGDEFFASGFLEQAYILVHEARHSDAGGYPHIRCPEDYLFVSAGQPHMMLSGEYGCDDSNRGAYTYQAAFLYELLAYGLVDMQQAAHFYNASISRVMPYLHKPVVNHYETLKTPGNSFEFNEQKKIIRRLNVFNDFAFETMWQSDIAHSWHTMAKTQYGDIRYTITFYRRRDLAYQRYRQLQHGNLNTAVIGSMLIEFSNNDVHGLLKKIKLILIGMGLNIE